MNKSKDIGRKLLSNSGSRPGLFKRGRTWASFISSGKKPVEMERFASQAMGAARTSASFLTRPVGIRSRADDFTGQDLIKAAISSVVLESHEAHSRTDLGFWWPMIWLTVQLMPNLGDLFGEELRKSLRKLKNRIVRWQLEGWSFRRKVSTILFSDILLVFSAIWMLREATFAASIASRSSCTPSRRICPSITRPVRFHRLSGWWILLFLVTIAGLDHGLSGQMVNVLLESGAWRSNKVRKPELYWARNELTSSARSVNRGSLVSSAAKSSWLIAFIRKERNRPSGM